MELSVVVPTLNGRDQLAAGLDALAEHASDAEVIVVNGPSADGTTGMVRERDDVDVLVEISDRTVNVARNAGIEVATGDVVAFVDFDRRIEPKWLDGVEAGLDRAPVVTGPTHEALRAGHTTETAERRTLAGRSITYFDGGNVAFEMDVLRDLDGFDEYLHTGGARDAAHRLAGMECSVAWEPRMSVQQERLDESARDWGWKYRALAYRMSKNYGIRPSVLSRVLTHAGRDAYGVARDVLRGEATPTSWVANGRDVLTGMATGVSDGFVARARDRSSVRNPHGLSTRADRAVARYDWRPEVESSAAADDQTDGDDPNGSVR